MADAPLDRICIRDLRLRCILGVAPEERREKQDISINIVIEADLQRACRTDSIDDTVDYKAIKKRVIAAVEASAHFLIERLAQRIAEICLEEPKVKRVAVSVDKPGALRFARSAAVEIVRERPREG
ncbi:MAG TPA: dihydroneopterin aldolase [Candidatus Hydrogenedentes bacterium]|nr:dihydroneopterin aldolase [Candidatus Hydrogenedentota bacterium]HPG68456.1 dihydroneopterin aldolase [Candidatus Hydrogenedentota bacterium]